MLEVRLIGTFDIRCDDKPVTLSLRSAQSLFSYLILTAGTIHRREKLAGLFWPNIAEERARAYLRQSLWLIRKALISRSKSDYLITDMINVSFNPSVEYWLDVDVLKRSNKTSSIDGLMDALSKYQGELLPGFYDDWITHEREHLQVIFEQHIAQLLELLESEKHWQDILEWAERWISLAQGTESPYRYLMLAYNAMGDREKVTSTYQRCMQALRELDLEPSEETRALTFKRNSKLNIPIPLTSFIGREKELNEIAGLFTKSRLITLTGSGGVGKTRLAIQVAADILDSFPNGVWFLDLAPLRDPALVPNILANLLSLRETEDISLRDLLINYFRSRSALVIFDNCEHLIESCAEFINLLLTSCEGLSVLATSREVLRVSGEISYRVPSLEVPKPNIDLPINELSNVESVQLFIERAVTVSPSFAISPQNMLTIVKICQRLDGIPLAIELAAARVNMLTIEQTLKRLDDRFNLLKGGLRTSLPRHKTLYATIEWSHNLLSEKERILFRRLAVFTGGWTLEAAEAIGVEGEILDALTRLVDTSLVLSDYEHGGGIRYCFLETILQYARERLAASAEYENIHARHLDYFLKFAQKAEQELYGIGQLEWMQKLEDEDENLRVALKWSLQGNINSGQQLAGALWWSWYLHGQLREGYTWLMKMVKASRGNETLVLGKLLAGMAWLAGLLGYSEQKKSFAQESLALYQKLGDRIGIATPLLLLGSVANRQADYTSGIHLLNESLNIFKLTENQWGTGYVLSALAWPAGEQGNLEQAQKLYQESLEIFQEIGNQEEVARTLYLMGRLAERAGDKMRAISLYEEALQIAKVIRSEALITWILDWLGIMLIGNGNFERGKFVLEEATDIQQKIGDWNGLAFSFRYLGLCSCLMGYYLRARSQYAESLQLSQQGSDKEDIADGLVQAGQLLQKQGYPEKFVYLFGAAERAVPNIKRKLHPFVRIEIEKTIENSRSMLGNESYTAVWEAGHRMSLNEAVTYTLKALQ